jgi:hypothetical protein
MKKNILLLFISFFLITSCSREDDPITVPSATAAQAVLDGGSINITWPAVVGTGITYNVYRNDNPVKINTAPLKEAKFTDVLTAKGSYTYTITVNLSGLESPKGIASEKVVLELPKTRTYESYSYSTSNGVTTTKIRKSVSVYIYDSVNITKLINIHETNSDSGSTAVSETKKVYTYSGNLITKIETLDSAGVVTYSLIYVYNDKDKLISSTNTSSTGSSNTNLFVYNADGTMNATSITTSVSGVVTTSQVSSVYTFLNGNLVKGVSLLTYPTYSVTVFDNLVYDTKYNPTKFILGFSNLYGDLSNINNLISSSTSVIDSLNTTPKTSSSRKDITYDGNGNVLTNKFFVKNENSPEQLSSITTFTY